MLFEYYALAGPFAPDPGDVLALLMSGLFIPGPDREPLGLFTLPQTGLGWAGPWKCLQPQPSTESLTFISFYMGVKARRGDQLN